MAISRKSMKDRLRERQETDYANRKGGGGRLFKNDLKGVEFWTCNEGDHIIDIVPYEVGENDPSLKPGDITYKLEIFVHSDVGQTEGHTICLNKTWGEKCPVCEEWKRLKDRGDIDDETLKALAPKRYPRVIYNIICYDNDEEVKKGVQVWHTSSYLMQTYLLELAKKPQRAGKGMSATTSIVFSDPDEGRSISFKRTGKKEDTKFVGIAFEPREYQLSDEDLEKAHCLDDLIARPTYDDVYEDFWGFRPGEEDTRTTRRPKEEPEPERPPRSRRPEPEPEPEPERPPRSRRPEPEPEDDVPEPEPEPEKEERKERPKASKSKGENLCPHGHEFGVDLDESPDCDDCSSWKDCAKENDRMEREERE